MEKSKKCANLHSLGETSVVKEFWTKTRPKDNLGNLPTYPSPNMPKILISHYGHLVIGQLVYCFNLVVASAD